MVNNPHFFTEQLMHWHETHNKRQMPWKGEKDAYKIWLSEVILQQTRVEQGWQYYLKFISQYPTLQALAAAKDEAVFKLWEGLGYYNRCRNLLATARAIAQNYNGIFPQLYNQVLALKGVGPYTAAAICSFAYNQPYAVVDGNVFRVLARYFGIDIPVDSTQGRKHFTQLAQQVLHKIEPAAHNQAIMDFGATICKPAQPLCGNCVLETACNAHLNGLVHKLPVKEKTLQKKVRYFTWLRLQVKDKTLIYQRMAKDIWQQLFELYLIETQEKTHWDSVAVTAFCRNVFDMLPVKHTTAWHASQLLTHQHIKAEIIEVELAAMPPSLAAQMWLTNEEIKKLAFPKILNDYFKHVS